MVEERGKNQKTDLKRSNSPVLDFQKRRLGLRGKMFFLFFFVPIIILIATSLLYLSYIRTLTGLITKESSEVVTKLAEEAIAEKGRSVAKEVERYLLSHPDLKKEDFIKDPVLKNIGIQKVGQTGYTCLVSKITDTELSALWLHPKEELIGKDIVKAMEKTLGEQYERWFKIQETAFNTGKETAGYYKWHDKREKYMVMVPVAGTNFFIPSTTYFDEFTLPMKVLEGRANALTATAIRTLVIILVAAAILITSFVVIYSYRLSGKLKSLSDAADKISLGDLDVKIDGIKSKDEIGDLAVAFNRMQTSVKLAIDRFREQRREIRA